MTDADAVAYLKQHGVAALVGKATTALTQERPENPRRWLAERIRGGCVDMPGTAKYLKSVGVGDIMDNAVAALVAAQPEDPREYLSEYILEKYCGEEAAPAQLQMEETKGREQFRVSFAAFEETRYTGTGSDFSSTYNDPGGYEATPPDPNIKVNSKVAVIEGALAELREYLLGTPWTDVGSGVEGWMAECRENNNSHEQHEDSSQESDEETDDTADDRIMAQAASGIKQTLQVLKECIAGYKRGEVQVALHISKEATRGGFGDVVQQFQDMGTAGDVAVELTPFPTRMKYDDFRQMHSETHVLMWAQICVSKQQSAMNQAQNFEIFVNLIGSSTYREGSPPKQDFDFIEVIPSFGQLVNVLQPGQHKNLCNPDSVVRVRRLVEGLHHFKLSLVRVAEHIIHSVVEGEFLTDVARRFSEAGITSDAHLFQKLAGRRQSCADFRRPSKALLDETIAEKARRRQSAPSVPRERALFDTLR